MDKRKLPHSLEHKKKISESLKGKERPDMIGNTFGFKKGVPSHNKGKKTGVLAWNNGLHKCLNTGRTHIKKGQHLSVKTQFGNIEPYNKGKTNIEERTSYNGIHNWVEYHKGKAKNHLCIICGKKQAYGWSNIDHKYKKDLNDYNALCQRCHYYWDLQFRKFN